MTLDGNRRPMLAIVSGRPGSGKTTLARTLAKALSCPLISRDEIKEGILYTFECHPDVADEDRVARSAFEAFFRVIKLLVTSDVTLVAEAAFQDQRWRIGLQPLLPIANLKVIHCTVDPKLAQQRVAIRRFEQRARSRSPRRGADLQATEGLPTVRPFEPLSLSVPFLHVATANGYDPSLSEIIAFVMSR